MLIIKLIVYLNTVHPVYSELAYSEYPVIANDFASVHYNWHEV